MQSRPICLASVAVVAILCSSCSKEGASPHRAEDVHETPNVSPTTAPGVAWRYAYDFQLPDDAIEKVQEQHASECEALGVTRCRITGLRYSVSDDDAVSAMLEIKLAPDIARRFGKQATTDVRKARGRLSNTEFTGEDTGPALSQAARAQEDLKSRIADIERQLGDRALKDTERAQLQSQLSGLRSESIRTQAGAADVEEKLASTPMTFNYYGKGGITGFAGRNPVMDAARSFVGSLVTMITFVLQALALLLPWAVLLALLVLLARSKFGRAARHFLSRSDRTTSEEE